MFLCCSPDSGAFLSALVLIFIDGAQCSYISSYKYLITLTCSYIGNFYHSILLPVFNWFFK